MPDWLNQYWIVIVIAAALCVLAVVFLVPRRDTRPPIDNAVPRKPLEPRRPDIAPARRNEFARDTSPEAAEAQGQMPPPVVTAPAAAKVRDVGPADNLSRMKGIGPKLVTRLGELGVTRFEQIAAWTDADIDRIDASLGTFNGRIRRDDWVEQSRLLAIGDTAGFEAKFGALG